MADDTTQRDIGRIEGKLDALIDAVKKQGEDSDQSRRRVYERIEKIETSVQISGKIDAQVRERLDKFDQRIADEVMPTINDVKRWRNMGMGALAVIGFGGAALGAFFYWAWDVVWSKIH